MMSSSIVLGTDGHFSMVIIMQEILKIAFYKGNKSFLQKLIALWTFGKYSHCVVLLKIDSGIIYTIGASNSRGVAEYRDSYKEDEWDILNLPCEDRSKVVAFIRERIGAEYDYYAVFFTHIIPLMFHKKGQWFCSEIIAAALGIEDPYKYHPNNLFKLLKRNHHM